MDSIACSDDFIFSYYLLSSIQKNLHCLFGHKDIGLLLNYATETPELYLCCIP